MTLIRFILLAAASAFASDGARAESCRRPDGAATGRHAEARAECRPEDRVTPYDPDAPKAGSAPGFVDLGNGTEIRVGGRVRLDYDVRR